MTKFISKKIFLVYGNHPDNIERFSNVEINVDLETFRERLQFLRSNQHGRTGVLRKRLTGDVTGTWKGTLLCKPNLKS